MMVYRMLIDDHRNTSLTYKKTLRLKTMTFQSNLGTSLLPEREPATVTQTSDSIKKAGSTMVQGAGCSRGYVTAVLVHPASADQIATIIQRCTLPAGWSCTD